jgi:cell division protein ZapA (FtsZ GTPase activity inhibitor)
MSSISSEASSQGQGVKTPTHVIPIEILGVSFTIKTDEQPEYIHGLVEELKNRLSTVSNQMRIVDPLKLSLVTALLSLDELHRDKDQKGALSKEYEASSLLDDLDRRLGELGL